MGATVECNIDATPALDETSVTAFFWLKANALCMLLVMGIVSKRLDYLTLKTVGWLRPRN